MVDAHASIGRASGILSAWQASCFLMSFSHVRPWAGEHRNRGRCATEGELPGLHPSLRGDIAKKLEHIVFQAGLPEPRFQLFDDLPHRTVAVAEAENSGAGGIEFHHAFG